ncbi:hypothetical protein D0869_13299 [Hortaea werneckii]|uniref:Anaphase-promoting complex subunit 4 WD40 domain-containing protein n=1 Tax=Hortaea werneckii TaxID=91943 RepID=A0A3M7AVS1_HORWE|nr:hypothetical protein D0869_13299 [Hortaea werneckii]RMX91303.1 hypothetical protein D0868_14069 [Hortaea werneckii]RMY31635.1 hypothetical protein D0866_07162 [Hortaea werneckii]
MAESVPAITLTDPQNRDTAPSPAQSPVNEAAGEVELTGAHSLPDRPGSRGSYHSRPGSAGNAWTSPKRLVQRTSKSRSPNREGSEQDGEGNAGELGEPEVAMDPLSQQIMKRTNASMPATSPSRPGTGDATTRRGEKPLKEQSPAPAVQEPRGNKRTETSGDAQKDLRKGVKAVSFLSRLMGSRKQKEASEEDALDVESMSNDGRPEGNDAQVFSQSIDNMGFEPRHPQPPAYIKVRAKNKKERELDHLFLAQELHSSKRRKIEVAGGSNKLRRKNSATPDANTIWAMGFSKDGKHLAAAGVDAIVRVWGVMSSADDRHKHEMQEASENEANGITAHAEHLSAPVFMRQPVREYEGHSSTILDLSWSKNNFLLTSSMDKTVRLWHLSRPECLCTFQHTDFVPSITFHPKDDRFFIAGSLDQQLRLWSIPDKGVAFSVKVPDMITAVGFTPDGKYCIAGCLSGLCMFYETEGLKYQTQIHVRSTRGQNAKGSKITGIQSHLTSTGDTKLVVTSNDSRIRIYNFRDKSLELKLRGNENNCSQIRASLSDDGRYIACGSEDRKVYLWSLDQVEGEKRDRTPVEMFEAHDTITTCVCTAPAKTRQLLALSEDPIYDLCNPPPVTLMSRAEQAQSETSSRPPTEAGSAQATPADADARFERPQPSPAYWTRSDHKGGNIMVAADFTGKIKVFRQDCASAKRKNDDADRASLFTKRSGRASRNGSLATKASQRSLREGRTSTSTQAPSDRILSWRQGIASTSAIANSSRRSSSKQTSRSNSPRKSVDQSGRSARAGSVRAGNIHPLPEDVPRDSNDNLANGERHKAPQANEDNSTKDNYRDIRPPGAPDPHSDDNPLMLQGAQSYMFWNTDQWKERARRMKEVHANQAPSPNRSNERSGSDADRLSVRGTASRRASVVSKLSDERSSDQHSDASDNEVFDDAREHIHE